AGQDGRRHPCRRGARRRRQGETIFATRTGKAAAKRMVGRTQLPLAKGTLGDERHSALAVQEGGSAAAQLKNLKHRRTLRHCLVQSCPRFSQAPTELILSVISGKRKKIICNQGTFVLPFGRGECSTPAAWAADPSWVWAPSAS